MIFDFGILTQLRLRLLEADTRNWLGFLGYDTEDRSVIQRLYGVYVLLFLAIWFVLMGSWAIFTAASIGAAIPRSWHASVLNALPWLLFVGQVLALVAALRSSPLKLSTPDMAYIAGSPLSRRAITLVGFGQALLLTLVVGAPVLGLFGVLLAAPGDSDTVQSAGLRMALVSLAFLALSLAVMWLVGVARLVLPPARRPLLWLVPLALAVAGWFMPIVRWPGAAVVGAISDSAIQNPVLIMSLLALVAVAAFGWWSNNVHMTEVAEESQFYAQLKTVGLYVLTDSQMAGRLLSQRTASRRTRPPRGRLAGATGGGALVARSLLSSLRQPLPLLTSFLWGAGLLYSGTSVLLTSQPAQVAATWLFVLLLVPPNGLVSTFRADVGTPFLRQLLPTNNFLLLLINALPPLGAQLLGWTVAVLIFGAQFNFVGGIVVLVLLALLMLFVRGLSLIPLIRGRSKIPYPVLALLGAGGMLLIKAVTGSSLVALASGMLVALFIGRLLYEAR